MIGDTIDVGIEILPIKSLQKNRSSGTAYYEDELYNLVRQVLVTALLFLFF